MFNGVKSSLRTHAGKAVIVPMTGRKPVMVTLLLRCSEQEFDETIRTMDPPVLFDSVTALQYEMSKEQRNFNTLSEELAMVSDKNSYQFRSISQDLMECQARLTILMNRSMKCFNQQKYIEANKSKSKKLPSPTRRTAKFYKVSPDSESLKSGDSQTSENHHHSSESKTSANQRVSAEIHTSGVFSTAPTNTDMRSESEQRLQANGYVIKQKVSESGETSGHSGHVIVDQRDSAHDSKSESIEIIENIPIDELKLHKASTSMKISISPTKEIKSDKLFYDGGDDKSKVLRESPEDSRSVKKLKSIFQQPEVERSKAETETRLKAELETKSPVLQLLSEKTDRQSEQTAATSSSVLTKTPDSKSTSLTIGQLSIGNDTIEKSEQTLVTSSPKLVKSEKKKIPDVVEKRDNIKELKQRFESRVTFDSNVLGYNDSGIDTSGSRSDSGTMETSEEEPEWPLFNKEFKDPPTTDVNDRLRRLQEERTSLRRDAPPQYQNSLGQPSRRSHVRSMSFDDCLNDSEQINGDDFNIQMTGNEKDDEIRSLRNQRWQSYNDQTDAWEDQTQRGSNTSSDSGIQKIAGASGLKYLQTKYIPREPELNVVNVGSNRNLQAVRDILKRRGISTDSPDERSSGHVSRSQRLGLNQEVRPDAYTKIMGDRAKAYEQFSSVLTNPYTKPAAPSESNLQTSSISDRNFSCINVPKDASEPETYRPTVSSEPISDEFDAFSNGDSLGKSISTQDDNSSENVLASDSDKPVVNGNSTGFIVGQASSKDLVSENVDQLPSTEENKSENIPQNTELLHKNEPVHENDYDDIEFIFGTARKKRPPPDPQQARIHRGKDIRPKGHSSSGSSSDVPDNSNAVMEEFKPSGSSKADEMRYNAHSANMALQERIARARQVLDSSKMPPPTRITPVRNQHQAALQLSLAQSSSTSEPVITHGDIDADKHVDHPDEIPDTRAPSESATNHHQNLTRHHSRDILDDPDRLPHNGIQRTQSSESSNYDTVKTDDLLQKVALMKHSLRSDRLAKLGVSYSVKVPTTTFQHETLASPTPEVGEESAMQRIQERLKRWNMSKNMPDYQENLLNNKVDDANNSPRSQDSTEYESLKDDSSRGHRHQSPGKSSNGTDITTDSDLEYDSAKEDLGTSVQKSPKPSPPRQNHPSSQLKNNSSPLSRPKSSSPRQEHPLPKASPRARSMDNNKDKKYHTLPRTPSKKKKEENSSKSPKVVEEKRTSVRDRIRKFETVPTGNSKAKGLSKSSGERRHSISSPESLPPISLAKQVDSYSSKPKPDVPLKSIAATQAAISRGVSPVQGRRGLKPAISAKSVSPEDRNRNIRKNSAPSINAIPLRNNSPPKTPVSQKKGHAHMNGVQNGHLNNNNNVDMKNFLEYSPKEVEIVEAQPDKDDIAKLNKFLYGESDIAQIQAVMDKLNDSEKKHHPSMDSTAAIGSSVDGNGILKPMYKSDSSPPADRSDSPVRSRSVHSGSGGSERGNASLHSSQSSLVSGASSCDVPQQGKMVRQTSGLGSKKKRRRPSKKQQHNQQQVTDQTDSLNGGQTSPNGGQTPPNGGQAIPKSPTKRDGSASRSPSQNAFMMPTKSSQNKRNQKKGTGDGVLLMTNLLVMDLGMTHSSADEKEIGAVYYEGKIATDCDAQQRQINKPRRRRSRKSSSVDIRPQTTDIKKNIFVRMDSCSEDDLLDSDIDLVDFPGMLGNHETPKKKLDTTVVCPGRVTAILNTMTDSNTVEVEQVPERPLTPRRCSLNSNGRVFKSIFFQKELENTHAASDSENNFSSKLRIKKSLRQNSITLTASTPCSPCYSPVPQILSLKTIEFEKGLDNQYYTPEARSPHLTGNDIVFYTPEACSPRLAVKSEPQNPRSSPLLDMLNRVNAFFTRDSNSSPGNEHVSYVNRDEDGEGPILGFEDENAIEYGADGSELVKARVHLKQWNPRLLLDELYRVKLMDEDVEDMSNSFIGMEGYMEKLPLGKRKSTLLKTWKRRYFKATDGWLHYYEPIVASPMNKKKNHGKQNMVHQENPTMSMQLMGGKLEVLESRILGIDDARGHYLMVRCPSEKEFKDWKLALDSQMLDNSSAVYIRPVLKSPPHPAKKVVIIDLGTASIRAGVLGKEASLPELFFPHIVAVDKSTGAKVVGKDAFKPEIRQKSMLVRPIQPSNKVDKTKRRLFLFTTGMTGSDPVIPVFNIDSEMADALFEKIFKDLNLDCSKYWILLSTPMNLSDNLKQRLMDILIHKFSVLGVCMVQQALLAMYSYKATSGIIVDVGERIEVLPITQGYIVDGGVSKQAFGAQKVMESLNFSLTEKRYRLFTAAEALIVRYVMEKSCYVSDRYAEEKRIFKKDPQKYLNNILLKDYELPPLTYESIEHDISTFKSAEGLFNPDLWGMDYPTLHKLVHRAIQAAPMDSRREICRSIYLSGGLTRLPGFAERLQMEVKNLVPSTLTIQVHAAPQRYHAAYIGACTLAAQDVFQQSCIDRKEWKEKGIHSLQKWHMPS